MNAPTLVLFTRDLRVHDHPALAAAAANGPVVPLFVLDDALLDGVHAAPNRVSFLLDSLHDLRVALADRGSTLLVHRGDVLAETMRVVATTGATAVHISADVSAYAARRQRLLRHACHAGGIDLRTFPGVTVVPAGELRTGNHDHYRVFTPYFRAWRTHRWREPLAARHELRAPDSMPRPRPIPALETLVARRPSLQLALGGEIAGRERMRHWLANGIATYAATHDALSGDGTSRLSPYLHFGCVSPLELATRSLAATDDDAFVRQLCWRDFHHQVTAAFPAIAHRDYRPRGRTWSHRPDLLDAWRRGHTGVDVVDAAMHQLRDEGWMPNRARLIAAGYLVKTLGVDWRAGAADFMDWLVDGDVANNSGNWPWVAGTGNDTRPNRGFNVERQAHRFDRDGTYAREHLPALVAAGHMEETA